MKHDAVIFDMDGLLLDTERLALQSFLVACEALDIAADASLYLQCIGTTKQRTREILVRALGETFSYDDLYRVWSEEFDRSATEKAISVKNGALQLLNQVRTARLPMALATSTPHERAVRQLQNAGLFDFFDSIIGGDHVRRGKPDAEIYLKAAGILGVSPARCLAIEDSDNGVRSAHAAGMTVIQVPDLVQPADDVRNLGHRIMKSLADVGRYLDAQA